MSGGYMCIWIQMLGSSRVCYQCYPGTFSDQTIGGLINTCGFSILNWNFENELMHKQQRTKKKT